MTAVRVQHNQKWDKKIWRKVIMPGAIRFKAEHKLPRVSAARYLEFLAINAEANRILKK